MAEVWAAFQSTGGEVFYAYATITWDSSFYITVSNIRYSSEESTYYFKWRVGPLNDRNNPKAGTDLGPKYSFQGDKDTRYIFQACTRESASKWGGTDKSGGFSFTDDSGGGDSGGGSGGESGSYIFINLDKNGYNWKDFTSSIRTLPYEYVNLSSVTPTPPDPITSSSSTFDITADANGGSFSGSTTTKMTATKSIITSYSFNGWLDKSSGSTYYSGITMGSSSITLYAQQSSSQSPKYSNNNLSNLPVPSAPSSSQAVYNATFDPKGGSVGTTSQSVTATISKVFGGWTSSKTSTSTISSVTESTPIVYAKWNSKYSNNSIVLPKPTKNGYNFSGWSTSESGTNLKAAGETVAITSNTTFYAIWTEKEKPKGGIFIHDGTMWQLATEYIFNEETWISSE